MNLRPCHFHKGLHRTGSHIIELGLVFRVLILTLEEIAKKIAKEKRERAQKSESTKKGNWLKCLPENVAHTVAINVENSTVMAPVSLYAITCVRIINPIAKRPYVPDGIKSVILWFYRSNSIKLSCNVCNQKFRSIAPQVFSLLCIIIAFYPVLKVKFNFKTYNYTLQS